MKAKETEIRFETGFQQSKTGLKKPILTSIIASISFYAHLETHFQLESGALLSSNLEGVI